MAKGNVAAYIGLDNDLYHCLGFLVYLTIVRGTSNRPQSDTSKSLGNHRGDRACWGTY